MDEKAAEEAVRLAQFDQLIINGEVRIGRLVNLIAALTESRLDSARVAAMIVVFEGRLRHWNENRLRLIDRIGTKVLRTR